MNTREWLNTKLKRMGDDAHKARVQAWTEAADAHGTIASYLEEVRGERDRSDDSMLLVAEEFHEGKHCECLARAIDAAAEGNKMDSVVTMDGKEVLVAHGILTSESAHKLDAQGLSFVEVVPEAMMAGMDDDEDFRIKDVRGVLAVLSNGQIGPGAALKRIAAAFMNGNGEARMQFMRDPHDLFDRVVLARYPLEMKTLRKLANEVGAWTVALPEDAEARDRVAKAYDEWQSMRPQCDRPADGATHAVNPPCPKCNEQVVLVSTTNLGVEKGAIVAQVMCVGCHEKWTFSVGADLLRHLQYVGLSFVQIAVMVGDVVVGASHG